MINVEMVHLQGVIYIKGIVVNLPYFEVHTVIKQAALYLCIGGWGFQKSAHNVLQNMVV